VIACSRRRDRDRETVVAAVPRDARVIPVDATPAWIVDALARGGPGLCASIADDHVLVWRRDANGRVVERLEFSAKHGSEPAERLELEYDRGGRLAKMVRRGGGDGMFDSTSDVMYDKAGRVERTRQHPDGARPFRPGDVNVTYRWKGKPLPTVVGRFMPDDRADPTQPLEYALAFAGTVHEAHYYDGSPAPQPESEYIKTYDERGRLVDVKATGWSDASRHDQLEWDADDQLITIRSTQYTTHFVWRDHRVVEARYLDGAGKDQSHAELRYDANGRLVEKLHFLAGGPQERMVSSTLDRERGELVTTYVTDDKPGPRARWSFRYDCGPPAR
jgi:YD repeat-containing protein